MKDASALVAWMPGTGMTTRRDVLRLIPAAGLAAANFLPAQTTAQLDERPGTAAAGARVKRVPLKLNPEPAGKLTPLDKLRVESAVAGRLVVRDGEQQVYVDAAMAGSAEFTIGGALGAHTASLIGKDGAVLDMRTFFVDCETQIDDDGGVFGSLLKDLYWTMATDGPVTATRYRGEVITYWASWLMDNTQTLKGMKYFWPEVKSNVDLYAESQREDGMIWENVEARTPPETYWDSRFTYADFARSAEGGYLQLRRAPVENHVEAFYLEAIYFSWKATGDTAWMKAKLDSAIRAVGYATSDAYRWSEKYQLLKRGFTVDTWDFLVESEAARVDGDIMKIDLKKTHFGIFFGDNTNLIAGMRRLAEMLEVAARGADAAGMRSKADAMEKRLNALAWNGEFFTHWIPEDKELRLELGVDLNRQVALSNAYTLNRNATHEKAVAIIKTYQRIRREMPATSPGEFYAIYPPFETGFGAEDAKWEYMNGGVLSCVAGELARGAFDNGYEQYGVDILRREKAVADRYRGVVPAILRGKVPVAPTRTWRELDMRSIANADFGGGTAAPGVLVWMGETENDLPAMPVGKQKFRDVEFEVIDPAKNGRRACLAIGEDAGFKKKETLRVNATAKSFYLLHTKGGDDLAGRLTVHYADGTSKREYVRAGVNINHWWAPHDGEFEVRYGPGGPERLQVAWRGANQKFGNVGVYVAGFENAHPEKVIASLEFESVETSAKWMILGVTLSDAEVFLPPWNELSQGMPNNWGAAALVFALVEGLAGAKDTGAAFDKALIAPRWSAAGVKDARVSVRYPASNGYVRYEYGYDEKAQKMMVRFTSSAREAEVAVLLPEGRKVRAARLNGKSVNAEMRRVEGSTYAQVRVGRGGAHLLEIELS